MRVDAAIVERRPDQDLLGSRAGGLHARTIEILDQRGIADRFLAKGQVAQVAGFARVMFDISDFPTRHPYGLGLWQNHIEHVLAGWVDELAVTVYREREVTGFAQDDTGVDIELSNGRWLRLQFTGVNAMADSHGAGRRRGGPRSRPKVASRSRDSDTAIEPGATGRALSSAIKGGAP